MLDTPFICLAVHKKKTGFLKAFHKNTCPPPGLYFNKAESGVTGRVVPNLASPNILRSEKEVVMGVYGGSSTIFSILKGSNRKCSTYHIKKTSHLLRYHIAAGTVFMYLQKHC
jgi:hypothetical protein